MICTSTNVVLHTAVTAARLAFLLGLVGKELYTDKKESNYCTSLFVSAHNMTSCRAAAGGFARQLMYSFHSHRTSTVDLSARLISLRACMVFLLPSFAFPGWTLLSFPMFFVALSPLQYTSCFTLLSLVRKPTDITALSHLHTMAPKVYVGRKVMEASGFIYSHVVDGINYYQ